MVIGNQPLNKCENLRNVFWNKDQSLTISCSIICICWNAKQERIMPGIYSEYTLSTFIHEDELMCNGLCIPGRYNNSSTLNMKSPWEHDQERFCYTVISERLAIYIGCLPQISFTVHFNALGIHGLILELVGNCSRCVVWTRYNRSNSEAQTVIYWNSRCGRNNSSSSQLSKGEFLDHYFWKINLWK